MANIGINVPRDGSASAQLVRSLGITWVRIVALPDVDLTASLRSYHAAGIRMLLVLARESGGNFAEYARRYAGLVAAVQVGNEPDLESPSSWTMTQIELSSLGKAARAIWPSSVPIVCAGLASGHPEWLDGMDLAPFDALAVHPYAKDSENPTDLEDQPDAQPLIRAYRRFGKPVIVSEWGWPSDAEPRASEEIRDMIGWAGGTSEIAAFFHFCISDGMVPPFGLLRADGSEKPAAQAFRIEATAAIPSAWPAAPTPAPSPAPTPAGPDPWQFWTAEQIATAAQCPLASVRENWPRVREQLAHCGLGEDRNTQIAMIGTIAIESASTFRPVREAFYLGEPEPAESYRKTLRYYPFYGRGLIQNTWRDSYAALGPQIAALWGASPDDPTFDLVAHPDNLLDPDMSAAAAALFFRDKAGGALAAAARSGNWAAVRQYVYGGPDPAGAQRIGRIGQALSTAAPPVPAPPPADGAGELALALALALRTLRDDTLPKLRDQLDEAERICEQFVGPRP